MAGSEPDSGGVARGKTLAWRSRSSRDMTGRDAGGSASGRDIGRDIANWWSSAVEQTSTFILDEVPATFAGLSVGAKELKPTLTFSGLSAGAKELKPSLTRGSSFTSFTLPWKSTVDGGKGVEDPTPRQEGEDATMSAPEAPCKSSERSQSRTPTEQPQESPPKSVGGSHSRKPAGQAREPSTSSPKPLKRSHSRKQVEKPLSPSPKPLERSQSRKEHEKPLSPPTTSPKLLERSQSTKHGEKPQEPSPKPPLERSQSRKQGEKPLSPSPKPLERSQFRKEHEKPLSPPIASPKLLERSQSRKHGEKPQEPSPKPLERSQSRKESEKPLSPSIASLKPLERSQSRKQGEKPQEPSPKPPLERSRSRKQVDKAHRSSTSSPKRSPLKTMTLQVEMKYEPILPSPKHVETPKQVSGFETPNQLGKSPLSTPKPSESSPAVTPDPRSSTGRQGESRRRTKRMAVDAAATESSPAQPVCLSTVSQEFLLGEDAAPGSAKAHSLEVLQRQHFWTPQKVRTDSPGEKSNPNSATKPGSSSKRSSASRSLARSLHLDRSLSPQLTAIGTPESSEKASEIRAKNVGVVLPREEIFPGKTNSLPQIRVRTPRIVESSTSLSKNPLIGGSTRVTNHEIREDTRTRLAGSLPTSPRHTSGESTTARLLRRLKFTGRGSKAGSDDSKLGKRRSAAQSGKAMTDLGPKESSDVHHDTLEPRQLDFSFMNWTEPDLGKNMLRESRAASNHGSAERSALHGGGNDAPFSSRKQQGNASSRSSEKKSSAWPWTFKWKWGLKSKSRSSAKGGSKGASVPTLPRPATKTDSSPTADIMSDARDNFGSQSDRISSAGSAEKLASDRAAKHRRVISWGADSTSALCSGSNATMAAFTPGQPRLATRDAQKLLVPPRKLSVPPNINVVRSQEQEVRKSNPGANVLRSSADTDVFEDCFGSFRSTDSPSISFGSLRSIESPTVSSSSIRKTMDADEWDSHVSSSFRQEINDDPCTSASKFRFKCPKVQQFNKFLRAQKERLRSGLVAGNTDRFCIVLTGRDLELSSIVAAMSYAWLQENSFPKVSGDLWHPVPMIDIPRQKMDKHRDAVWLFDACGIDPGSLLFADETELSVLVGAGRIKMSIIGQDVLVTRNEVGSVCTLLMEMLLAEHRALLQPRYLKAFMLAGILVDTENLDFASIRDTEMSNILVEGIGSFGRTSFFNQLREAEDDARVSKLITQNYDNQPSARLKLRVDAEHEHSDRDSIFTQSQDHTSTSEAGTNSSLDEDSPRPKLKQRNSFRYSRLTPHTAPARSHRLSLPGNCMDQDAQAVAHIRKAATQFGHPSSALPSYGQNHHRAKSGAFARIRKKLFFE